MASTPLNLSLPHPEATDQLGHELALLARPGDVILLEGDLGAGKSSLARAFLRSLLGNPEAEIPSPTFTLIQLYEDARIPASHADLYRLSHPDEAYELGMQDMAQSHVQLIEWPDRLEGEILSPNSLHIHLDLDHEGRIAELTAEGTWQSRLEKFSHIRRLLQKANWQEAERQFLEGDASTRRYERLIQNNRHAILMDMPARDDRTLLANGKTYSETAKLATSIHAVAAINQALSEKGFSAPKTYASDLDHGLMLLEDLGDQVFGRLYRQNFNMAEPLKAAISLLANIAQCEFSPELKTPEGQIHTLPTYDAAAFRAELDVYLDWYVPNITQEKASADFRQNFHDLWHRLLAPSLASKPVLVMRDYHSPNLIWLPERKANARIGLIDTQDALLGPAAYDVASLIQDARVAISHDVAQGLLEHYCSLRQAEMAQFSPTDFSQEVWILSTQRIFKILGIFLRLAKRDGKRQYLSLIPQLFVYLDHNLALPSLSPLREFLPSWRPDHV